MKGLAVTRHGGPERPVDRHVDQAHWSSWRAKHSDRHGERSTLTVMASEAWPSHPPPCAMPPPTRLPRRKLLAVTG